LGVVALRHDVEVEALREPLTGDVGGFEDDDPRSFSLDAHPGRIARTHSSTGLHARPPAPNVPLDADKDLRHLARESGGHATRENWPGHLRSCTVVTAAASRYDVGVEYDITTQPVYPALTKIAVADVKTLSDHPWF